MQCLGPKHTNAGQHIPYMWRTADSHPTHIRHPPGLSLIFSRLHVMLCLAPAACSKCAWWRLTDSHVVLQTLMEGSTGSVVLQPGDRYAVNSGAAIKFGNIGCTITYAAQPMVRQHAHLPFVLLPYSVHGSWPTWLIKGCKSVQQTFAAY